MTQDNWNDHLAQIEKIMKGQPFWKIALFGVMCIRRQWPVYERLCVGREWGNAKQISKVIERFWKAIPTGYAIGDSYMGIIEDSAVVGTEDWDALAEGFIVNMIVLFELFESKDKKAARSIAERNRDFLDLYLDDEANDYQGVHPLMAAEQEFQLQLAEELGTFENKDKKTCIQKYHEQEVESILRDFWFTDYPEYKPVKRKNSSSGSDGLRFRTAYQKATPINKSHIQFMEQEAKIFAALEKYRVSGYNAEPFTNACAKLDKSSFWPMENIVIEEFAAEEYQRFYHGMCFSYHVLAEDLYLRDQPMEETLKALYRSAKSAIISAQLYQRACPEERISQKMDKPEWGFQLNAPQLALLIYEYDTAFSLMDEHTSPFLQFFYRMLCGKYAEAEALLDECEKAADPIYRGADIRLAAALCRKDPEEIRNCAIKMLRAIRMMESIYCEVFPAFLILAMRCAAQMGISIRKINVSELPEQLTGIESPFDVKNSMPFGVEVWNCHLNL